MPKYFFNMRSRYLIFLALFHCTTPQDVMQDPDFGHWPEHPCYTCHEVLMPFFLQSTTATSGDAAWTDTSTLSNVVFTSVTTAAGTSTDEAAFNNPYTISANTMAVGDVYSFELTIGLTALAGTKDNVIGRVRIGGLAGVLLGESQDSSVTSTVPASVVTGWFRVLSLGAGGTISIGSNAIDFGARTSFVISASTALDTTVDQALVATYEGENGTEYIMSIKVWKGAI